MERIRFKDYLIDYLEYNNISQKDFASRIGITPKHLIDILSGKKDISAPVILAISLITDIPADYIYKIEANYKLETKIDNYLEEKHLTQIQYLNKYKYKDLILSNYIDFKDKYDKMEIIKDILKFLRVSSPEKVYNIDPNIFYKSKNDKPELLLLWLEKCYRESLKQEVQPYKKENINILVKYILDQAKKEIFDEKNLIKEFNKNGVYLVIQDDLPGSKIRGAFKVHLNKPAIYLTHKHKRIADIYFALLHELAHLKSDFNKAKATNLVSYDDNIDQLETKADITVYNWMVSNDYYEKVCKSINYNIALEENYPKSFIVYRMAKDNLLNYNNTIYQQYNFIIKDKKV